MSTDDRVASALADIRGRGYRNGATGAECARLSDAAAEDVPLLLAAIEAVLAKADEWRAVGRPESAEEEALMWRQIECGEWLRAAIATALTGKEAGG
jgi:hypothetical protein